MAKGSQKMRTKINIDNSSNCNDQVASKITSPKVKQSRKRSSREFSSQRSSIYRGVTRHRWTGRYEAHLWDKNCWNDAQKKKGRQVYLGAYDDEEAAARAYDMAALKYWGKETLLNYTLSNYENEMKEMEGISREEYIGTLRRKSSGFSRGVSKYRGVARHHHNGRWEARIGRVFGNKYLYLGTYATQEEAATAYDTAAVKFRGPNAVTNFDLSRYVQPKDDSSSCIDQSSPDTSPCILQTRTDANIFVEAVELSDDNSSTVFLGHAFEHVKDQLDHTDITIDDALWGGLFDVEGCGFLECSPNDKCTTFVEGQSCPNEEDFFSDLSSFLCDFDVPGDEQIVI